MRLYQRVQPTCDTSTLRIARFSNHRLLRQLPRGPPGRNLGEARDRVEPRLTASLQLWRRTRMTLGLPRAEPRSALRAPDPGPSERRSLVPALSAGSDGHCLASDVSVMLSTASVSCDSHIRRQEQSKGPPLSTASSKAAFFLGPERLPSPAAPRCIAFAMLRQVRTATSATVAIHEHNPGSP